MTSNIMANRKKAGQDILQNLYSEVLISTQLNKPAGYLRLIIEY